MVAFGQSPAELGILIQEDGTVYATQFMQDGRDIIRDEPIAGTERTFLQYFYLPSGIIEMDAVQKSTGLKEVQGDRFKQMRVLQHIRHRMLGIAYESHGCRTFMGRFATIERFVRQVILHRIYQLGFNAAVRLLLILVPRDNIPITYKSQQLLIARHLYEQPCAGHVTAAHQYRVGREFLIDV